MNADTPLQAVSLDLARVSGATWLEQWNGCLLHGFGASAQDLVSLAPALGLARHWTLPHAPNPITVAGMSYGRAWFPREAEALQQALFGTYFQNLRELEPRGLRDAAAAVRQHLTALGFAWERLIIGGFSQGGMVAAEIIRQSLEDPSLPMPGVVLLFSGSLIAERWWQGLQFGEDSTHPQIYQSHGTTDTILPLQEGQALTRALEAAGLTVTYHQFEGGHTIPPEILETFTNALRRRYISS